MIDLTFLRKFTKEDPVKMKRYISLYMDVAPKTFEEMERNLRNEEWEQLRINAHSLKPQTEFMGIISLKEELIKIEEAVKMNHLDGMEALFISARQLSDDSVTELKEAFAQL
jgi:HPt (histidine-containing phosphotransfer) domain-containing protein